MIITLTTDFGLRDPFVGQMKGVILGLNPEVSIVDITHEITPYAIEEAAFILGESYSHFPMGSIHLAVVDPGVGSSRRAIIVEADGHLFVGPDNGIFSFVIMERKPSLIVQIDAARFCIRESSATFHGRDLFAPVAARLSLGMPPRDFGTIVHDPVLLSPARAVREGNLLRGKIVHLDRFGNCITSVRSSDIDMLGRPYHVVCKGRTARAARFYGEIEGGELGCLINSSGFLELFIPKGNASAACALRIGDEVEVVKGA